MSSTHQHIPHYLSKLGKELGIATGYALRCYEAQVVNEENENKGLDVPTLIVKMSAKERQALWRIKHGLCLHTAQKRINACLALGEEDF